MTKITCRDGGAGGSAVYINDRPIPDVVEFQAHTETTSSGSHIVVVELTLHVDELDYTDQYGTDWYVGFDGDQFIATKTEDT